MVLRRRPKKRGLTVAQIRGHFRKADADTLHVAKRVYEEVEKQQISIAELARRSGINRVTLYQYLNPERHALGPLRISVVRAMAQGCHVSIHDLLRP